MDDAPAKIVLAAFPKTGGALLGRVFRKIAGKLKLRFRHLGREGDGAEDWDILFAPDGKFGELLNGAAVRGIAVVRDPRDLVVNRAHRHAQAEEAWLSAPLPEYGGRSYREALLALPPAERYAFEMDGASGAIIRSMLEWAPPPPGFALVPLELLQVDASGELFRRVLTHLGLAGAALEVAVLIAARVVREQRERRQIEQEQRQLERVAAPAAHVQGEKWLLPRPPAVAAVTAGPPLRWHAAFTPEVAAAFQTRFGDAAERLGYAPLARA